MEFGALACFGPGTEPSPHVMTFSKKQRRGGEDVKKIEIFKIFRQKSVSKNIVCRCETFRLVGPIYGFSPKFSLLRKINIYTAKLSNF